MAGSSTSYFSENTGGQLIPALQFIIDHALDTQLPDNYVRPGATDPADKDYYLRWVINDADARAQVHRWSIRASSIVDSFEPRFTGMRLNRDGVPQALAWPRQYAFLNQGAATQGSISQLNSTRIPPTVTNDQGIEVDYIPHLICLATAHIAIRLANNQDPFGNWYDDENMTEGRTLVKRKIGDIEHEWLVTGGGNRSQVMSFSVKDLLKPLLRNTVMTVSR